MTTDSGKLHRVVYRFPLKVWSSLTVVYSMQPQSARRTETSCDLDLNNKRVSIIIGRLTLLRSVRESYLRYRGASEIWPLT